MIGAVFLLIGGCGDGGPPPLSVSIIGVTAADRDPDRRALSSADAMLMRETAQGLVAIGSDGAITAGLAESWTITTDGLSAIFRIRDATFGDGTRVRASHVEASLRRALAPGSRNDAAPYLDRVDSVIAMTDRVVEIRLSAPHPELLSYLAMPELGIRRAGDGAGPWRVADRRGTRFAVTSADPPPRAATIDVERAARAVVRFADRDVGIVTGGTLADIAIAQAIDVPRGALRIDPAEGLFALAAAKEATGPAADPAMRAAMARAVNRTALAAMVDVPRWQMLDRSPLWPAPSPVATPATVRAGGRVRVALPDGPGMRLLTARLQADWRALGITVVRVAPEAAHDLYLIDAVAPGRSARWYRAQGGCNGRAVCPPAVARARADARAADTPADADAALRAADLADARAQTLIVLAQPLRWSLVRGDATGFRENALAVHRIGGRVARGGDAP